MGNSSDFGVSLTKNSETSQAPPHTLAIEFSTSLLGDEDNVLTSSPSLAWERMGQQFEPRAEHFLDEFADSLDTGLCWLFIWVFWEDLNGCHARSSIIFLFRGKDVVLANTEAAAVVKCELKMAGHSFHVPPSVQTSPQTFETQECLLKCIGTGKCNLKKWSSGLILKKMKEKYRFLENTSNDHDLGWRRVIWRSSTLLW